MQTVPVHPGRWDTPAHLGQVEERLRYPDWETAGRIDGVVDFERCDECGFNGEEWSDAAAISAIEGLPTRFVDVVAGLSSNDLLWRPVDGQWSIAEYADHVREAAELLSCEKCGAALGPPASRRRRVWHGSWLKKGAASDEMTRLLGDAQRGSYVQPDKLTLSEWVEKRWLPSLSVRESTRHSYARNLRTHVLPRLGSIHLQKITPSDLNTLYRTLGSEGHKGHRVGEGLAPRTVRYIHTIIGRALGDAVLENLLTVNPAQRATPRGHGRRPRPRRPW